MLYRKAILEFYDQRQGLMKSIRKILLAAVCRTDWKGVQKDQSKGVSVICICDDDKDLA